MPALTPKKRDWYKRAEIAARRKLGGGVVHPDHCPKLLLCGVEWAIPTGGAEVVPDFGEDGAVEFQTEELDWPEIIALREQLTVTGGEVEVTSALLSAAFKLVRRALLVQYCETFQMDGAEVQLPLADLLRFRPADPPIWLRQLMRWAVGLSPQFEEDPFDPMAAMAALESLESMDPGELEPEPEAPRRSRWKFWSRG